MKKEPRSFIGDDGDIEWPCKHGVGHSSGAHTCDGCCTTVEFWQSVQKQQKCGECGNPISFHKMDCSRTGEKHES